MKPPYRSMAMLLATLSLTGCESAGIAGSSCPEPEKRVQYLIGPGDTLSISVWGNGELSASVPVRPDGMISTPLVKDMVAAGLTPTALAAGLEEALGKFVRSPSVTVIVQSQGAANQIHTMGALAKPGGQAYRDGLRLLDVVVAAGGLTAYAAGDSGRLLRKLDDGTEVRCTLRIEALMQGAVEENMRVFPGDVVIVPESWL